MRLPNIISFDETEYGHLPGKPVEDGIQKQFFWDKHDVTKPFLSWYSTYCWYALGIPIAVWEGY